MHCHCFAAEIFAMTFSRNNNDVLCNQELNAWYSQWEQDSAESVKSGTVARCRVILHETRLARDIY